MHSIIRAAIAATLATGLALVGQPTGNSWAAPVVTLATLPQVNVPTVCTTNNTAGTFWAIFQSDSSNRRRPYRGGFTANTKWNIAAIQVIGAVGSRGYTDGTVTFNPDVRAASDYTPASTPYGSKASVSLAIYLVFTDGKKCSINIPSN